MSTIAVSIPSAKAKKFIEENLENYSEEFHVVFSDRVTETRIEIERDENFEEISFRTQGERLALIVIYNPVDGEDSKLLIYPASPEVDLKVFAMEISKFYEENPYLLQHVIRGFEHLEPSGSESDQEIFTIVMGRKIVCS